jgi:plastocyanin
VGAEVLVGALLLVLIASPAQGQGQTVVRISAFGLDPAEVTVPVGGQVQWLVDDPGQVRFDLERRTGVTGIPGLALPSSFVLKFEAAGVFPFHVTRRGTAGSSRRWTEAGKVIVQGLPAPAPTVAAPPVAPVRATPPPVVGGPDRTAPAISSRCPDTPAPLGASLIISRTRPRAGDVITFSVSGPTGETATTLFSRSDAGGAYRGQALLLGPDLSVLFTCRLSGFGACAQSFSVPPSASGTYFFQAARSSDPTFQSGAFSLTNGTCMTMEE